MKKCNGSHQHLRRLYAYLRSLPIPTDGLTSFEGVNLEMRIMDVECLRYYELSSLVRDTRWAGMTVAGVCYGEIIVVLQDGYKALICPGVALAFIAAFYDVQA